jgi:ATP-dependent Clp protease adaptor protein ClpS
MPHADNDNYNKREYVVKVLLKVVDGFTVNDAMVVMQEAHETGVALVVTCPQVRGHV